MIKHYINPQRDELPKVMINLLTDKGFDSKWVGGIQSLSGLEKELFRLIDAYQDDESGLKRIFHLIQIWGGYSGRGIYLSGDGFDWLSIQEPYATLVNTCIKTIDTSPNSINRLVDAAKAFNLKVNNIGVSFISKHIRFWSYKNLGDMLLPVYDKVMFKAYLPYKKHININQLGGYWRWALNSLKKGQTLFQFEREVYNKNQIIMKKSQPVL